MSVKGPVGTTEHNNEILISVTPWQEEVWSLFYKREIFQFSSVQFTQLCLSLCNPMHCSTAGFPVHHGLPELAQTHVHRVGDGIQPSHPLSSPSPPAFNLSQHDGLIR